MELSDAFYAAWAEDLLDQALQGLLADYNRAGKGDYFRILHGRICEELPMADIAAALNLTRTAAEAYFRQARLRLSDRLQDLVRWQVSRYSSAGEADSEFVVEWARLGDFFRDQGGLEAAVRRSCR